MLGCKIFACRLLFDIYFTLFRNGCSKSTGPLFKTGPQNYLTPQGRTWFILNFLNCNYNQLCNYNNGHAVNLRLFEPVEVWGPWTAAHFAQLVIQPSTYTTDEVPKVESRTWSPVW